MPSIAFIDTEIDVKSRRILDIGAVRDDGNIFHATSEKSFREFINSAEYLCGHNVLNHDIPVLEKSMRDIVSNPTIDTLFLSPLLFPSRPYHTLVKDDKINPDGPNNPYNDAVKARDLFYDEVNAFKRLDENRKAVYHSLLSRTREFAAFFKFVNYHPPADVDTVTLINATASGKICEDATLANLISNYPIELAYSLSLILGEDGTSITPPWILKNFPAVDQVVKTLRSRPCLQGCAYCNQHLDPHLNLRRFFGFDQFRTYAGQPLQEQAVRAAIDGKSLLAVFPTGGGKSLTFQLPALIAGEAARALTVVISPLQSLMKDQVDNLRRQDITQAVTINGLLDPIERSKAIEQVESGDASLLYISPELLRSPTIKRLLLGRKIARFVIDEAHCFSAWGQDFRVDYLYIGDFIHELEKDKNLAEKIPVSCFTATAKQKVIEDIREYFSAKNGVHLDLFTSSATRTNLTYKVFEQNDEAEKYATLRNLIEEKDCPTIVYVSRTYRAEAIAKRLCDDGIEARPYHGKMDVQEKTANQDAFIRGEVQVMVATSAFGMGLDKKDVGLVVHYEISDSLENYVQEAGRAGRDERISANCYVLFNEEDLSKHFVLLNQTKLSIREIQQVWRAIKSLTNFSGRPISNSALEIARRAGWDDNVKELETRVTTAIAALEDARYLQRGQNSPRIFANSIRAHTAQDAINRITASPRFDEKQKEQAIRIVKKLFSAKRRKQAQDELAESRVDYISDHLGIVREQVINIINLLRDEQILADQKDLTAYVRKEDNKNRSLSILETSAKIERCLLDRIQETEVIFNVKKLNEELELQGCKDVSPTRIRTIINFWATKNWVKRQHHDYSRNTLSLVCVVQKDGLKEKVVKRHQIAQFVVNLLFAKVPSGTEIVSGEKAHLVEFSVHEIRESFNRAAQLFNNAASTEEIEDALFFLSRIEAIKIEGGFLVVYNRLTLNRLEQNNKIQYRNEHYEKLSQFYESRVQQIHIVGEYARKMVDDYKSALQFVEDYFRLNYSSFLNRYFRGDRQAEIKRNITPAKFRQLFGTLSARQLEIIKDKASQYIVVAAGPGSGKTRVLVHKLASLALMEDVKTDQMLMVTFSRAAVTDFKKKLQDLIGNVAHFIEIKTFHAYCFDLLGKVGTLEKADRVINETVEKIKRGEVEAQRITKTVLVIDEAQDMDASEFALVNALIETNDDMRVIAVGDDDQNIFAFRGSDSKYMQRIRSERSGKLYELTENYRSATDLVAFSNEFVKKIPGRLKTTPITSTSTQRGTVKLTRYTTPHLINPVVSEIIDASLSGSTCVLVRTNEEAATIVGLLRKHKFDARLIQSNDGFNLFNLFEVRYFIDQLALDSDTVVISDEAWSKAKRAAQARFENSRNREILKTLISSFEASSGRRKFKSDFEVFVRESRLEDFYQEKGDVILVSTIHKAKGREFDNVFLMMSHDAKYRNQTEELRPLYVAITRAKTFLSIHTNGNSFDGIRSEGLVTKYDDTPYTMPTELVAQLTLKDVWLDFFMTRQHLYRDLVGGSSLVVKSDGCLNKQGEYLLKFSQKYKETVADLERRGYRLAKARVSFIVYWKKEGAESECKVIVPELGFERVAV